MILIALGYAALAMIVTLTVVLILVELADTRRQEKQNREFRDHLNRFHNRGNE